jgi:hypothetical protein
MAWDPYGPLVSAAVDIFIVYLFVITSFTTAGATFQARTLAWVN